MEAKMLIARSRRFTFNLISRGLNPEKHYELRIHAILLLIK